MSDRTMSVEPLSFLADLQADGPYQPLADRLATFGQFVGRWDMLVEFFDDAGERIYQEPGTWSFAWVLDGRAIQDVLTYPRTDETGPVRGIGSSMRTFEAATGMWQVIWFGVVTGITAVLWGGPYQDRIRLDGVDPDGTLNRWEFSEIAGNRFLWHGFESADKGAHWHLRQKMTAHRDAT